MTCLPPICDFCAVKTVNEKNPQLAAELQFPGYRPFDPPALFKRGAGNLTTLFYRLLATRPSFFPSAALLSRWTLHRGPRHFGPHDCILFLIIAFWSSSLDFDTLHCFGPLHYVDPHHYFGHCHSISVIVFGFLLRRWWLNLKLGTSLQMQTSGKEEGSLDSDNVVFLHRILSKLHKRKHLYVFKLES